VVQSKNFIDRFPMMPFDVFDSFEPAF